MKQKNWYFPIVFALVAMLLAWLSVSDQSPARLQSAKNDPMQWSAGWQAVAEDGHTRSVLLPARLNAGERSVIKTLPENLTGDEYVYIKTDYQAVTADVDGQALAVVGLSSLPGNLWHADLPWVALRLTPDMAGRALRFTFNGAGLKPFVEVYSVRLGPMAKVQLALSNAGMFSMILSILISLFSLAMLTFAIMEARRYQKRISRSYYYLMGFVALACTWFFTDSDVSGAFYLANPIYLYVYVGSYFLMPLMFLLFVCSTLPRMRRLCVSLIGVQLAGLAVQVYLLATGRFVLWRAAIQSHVLLLATLGTLLAYVRFMYRAKKGINIELVLGTAILTGSWCVSLMCFYLFPLGDNVSVFRFGTVVMVISLTGSVLHANVDVVMQMQNLEDLRIHEEEYRIAVQQSDKFVIRFDVANRSILPGESLAPVFDPDLDLNNMPESAIAQGLVGDESIADFRAFFEDMIAGKEEGAVTASLRN